VILFCSYYFLQYILVSFKINFLREIFDFLSQNWLLHLLQTLFIICFRLVWYQRHVENTFYRLNHSQVNFFRYHQLTWLNHVDVELASKVDLKILRAGPN
jgi:hypothetical protein